MTATHCWMQVTMFFQLKGYGVRSVVPLRQGHESLLSGLPVAVALTKLRAPDYKTITTRFLCISQTCKSSCEPWIHVPEWC